MGMNMADKLIGGWLIAAITSVCSAGFLLFGYDQGVMSGVVISKYWLAQMGHPSQLMVGTITVSDPQAISSWHRDHSKL